METQQPEINDKIEVSPAIENELNDALSKHFNIDPEPSDAEIKPDEKVEPEVKAEPNVDQKPEVKPEEKSNKELIDPDKVDPNPPFKGQNTKEGWNTLRNNYKQAHRLAAEKDIHISKLNAAMAEKEATHKKELEALKTEKSELEKYRAMVDIQADPEFISKYDQPIEKAVNGIKEQLKNLGATQATIDSQNFNDPSILQKIIDSVHSTSGSLIGSKLERKIREYSELLDKRDETLNEQRTNYKQTIEKRKQESFVKQSESEGRMIKHVEAKVGEKDKEGKPVIAFLNRMEPKEGASEAELNSAKSHNDLVDQMNARIQNVIKMNEPEDRAEVAIAAVASHWFAAQNKVLSEQLKKAQEMIQKMSAVNSETPSRKPSSVPRNVNNEPVTSEEALNAYMATRR